MSDDWISATATHNYFNEPLLDWFKYAYKNKHMIITSNSTPDNYLCAQGIEFEKKVIDILRDVVGKKNMCEINGNVHENKDAKRTLECMKKGYYIIHGGVLKDHKHKCHGVPDLLVRSDKMRKIFATVPDIDTTINAPLLGKGKWHYCVVDIKFMTLNLKCDGTTLLNSRFVPAYKSQLYIYNRALGRTQGYKPSEAYLLGRRWVYQKCGQQYFNDHCLDKLGVIDFKNADQVYCDQAKSAIDWIKLCKSPAARKWNVFKYPLSRVELYPNMANHGGKWHDLKTNIATANHELTQIWQVGKKHRDKAIEAGVNNWMDEDCSAEILGLGGRYGEIVNKIINVNRDDDATIEPMIVENNKYGWKDIDKIEFFVDFEFRNAVFDNDIKLPIADKSCILFMIGVGYMHPKKYRWTFKDFTVDHINENQEADICIEFLDFIHRKSKKYNVQNPKCWHWSQAEPNMFNNAAKRHCKVSQLLKKRPLQWCDLLSVFQAEPIVVKGCLNFKLKDMAKAMYNHGFISTIWKEDIASGHTAMIEAVKADRVALDNNEPLVLDSIVQYNEIDVKVLQEMLTYVRRNMAGTGKNKRKKKLDTTSSKKSRI